MELKRIIARDSRSANEKAIQMYGSEVLIISTQQIEDQTELIVAVENEMTSSVELTLPVASTSPEAVDSVTGFDALLQKEMASKPAIKPAIKSPAKAASKSTAKPKKSPAIAVNQVEAGFEIKHELIRSREVVDLLRQEIEVLRKEFLLSRQLGPWQQQLSLAPEIQLIFEQMKQEEMPASLSSLLIDSIKDCQTAEHAKPILIKVLTEMIKNQGKALPESGIHALAGPSGSGKTLMMARLAMAAQNSAGQTQILISYQDGKPGAWSQLQMLAAQLGLDAYRAHNAEALKLLLDEMAHVQCIWIDTGSVNFIEQAESLKKINSMIQIHAVLPVDATVTHVKKILLQNHSWSSLMLSKNDEAYSSWPLIQGLSQSKIAISAVSQGERVTSALACWQPNQMAEIALKHFFEHSQPQTTASNNEIKIKPVASSRRRTNSKAINA
jgi:flagellar biosynthesis GTPase FlhF